MLVLASTSRYRRELLSRLQLDFSVAAPDVDETPLPGESPSQTALRLALAKAEAVAKAYPAALVIGADQVAECDGLRLDKPGTHERAAAQLSMLSGHRAVFHTAIVLLHAPSRRLHTRLVPVTVSFRTFGAGEIESYLRKEQPYDCAGSAKSEGLGIALIASMDCPDPTALIGLPLIALVSMLEAEGVRVV
ncbi:MAG: septum formation protein Maf [Burkholderiales bacterium]|nr:septum formation protein Maf [Burkholderiales bacterium]